MREAHDGLPESVVPTTRALVRSRASLLVMLAAMGAPMVTTGALSLVVSACGDTASAGSATGANGVSSSTPPSSSTPSSQPSGASTATPTASASASSHEPLQLLKFTFTSEVKNREPVDVLKVAEAGKKAWAHVTLRNRSKEPRRVTLYFYVDGEQRSMVDLKVSPSWSYRTYAFNTLKDSDKDRSLRVEVRDDTGTMLVEEKIPIKAKAVTADLPKSKKGD
ncbi:MAG: hypothetical protein U0165_15715 [Polyangiaceae bacterium]